MSLAWVVIGQRTVNVSVSPIRFVLLFLVLAWGSILWWWLFVEAMFVARLFSS